MTLSETAQILAIIKATYPSFMSKASQDDFRATVKIWHSFIGEFDLNTVNTALRALISTRTSEFAPSVGALMDKIYSVTHEQGYTGLERWNLVQKAIRNSGYHAKEEFEKLPQDCKDAVGSHETLRDWALLPMDELGNAQARFIKSYEVSSKRKREIETMPQDIRALIEDTANKHLLGQQGDDDR